MGLGEALSTFQRIDGVRMRTQYDSSELTWPSHPTICGTGFVARRNKLDALVLQHAESAGAIVLRGVEALAPIVERGFVRGAIVVDQHGVEQEVRATYVVVADGANSRFGRSLGTFRQRSWPYATAIRGYWASPRHAENWIETTITLLDRDGRTMPGYGWVYPLGDGTINVGVGLLSTYPEFRNINTSHLLEQFVEGIAPEWMIDPQAPIGRPTSGRIPMGGSVEPKAGPTYLVVGDAAGTVNPFNGDGIAFAYATARIAADVLHEALGADDPTRLQLYTRRLDEAYGNYFKAARLFARAIGHPSVLGALCRLCGRSDMAMRWLLRLTTNALRPNVHRPVEVGYRIATHLMRFAPKA